MDKLTDIKVQLDALYREYKDNGSKLNSSQSKKTVALLVKMTNSNEINAVEIVNQLTLFPAEITRIYFEQITKGGVLPIDLIDMLLNEFLLSDMDTNKSQFYVLKYVSAVSEIMKNYKGKALQSVQLPKLVAFIARFAAKPTTSYKEKFKKMIDNTDGGIYVLDYSDLSKQDTENIWNVTNMIYPELSKSKYSDFITDWAFKYGFASKQTIDEQSSDNSAEKESDTISTEQPMSNEAGNFADLLTKKICENIKTELNGEQKLIVSAFSDAISPLSNAVNSFRGEIYRSHETAAENVKLKAKNEEMENRIRELNKIVQVMQVERKNFAEIVSKLETEKAELDAKLNAAYAINSREESLEVERIRTNISKESSMLYEEWLDVIVDDYESLQAIIKKFFRTLERNGINFKENVK
ncbi:MAG: hypothetical protein NC253_06750 [Ruminococcus sp.]|nr:hypothetical protein [Ruminococcus sp.]MCM1381793.1 hypothetical protein [Muribaculaceae bacterium]MCM1479167.1 hypothetical protein [Muribaculaceae bacterium]